MKAYFDIEQKSVEWFELRHAKIGGTTAKELFVKSDTLLFKMLAQYLEPFDEDVDHDGYSSDAMERGNELEPQAIIELEKYTGFSFLPCGWIQSKHSLLGISPDGITKDLTIQAEVKCPSATVHIKYVLGNEIPLDYINQCVHAFTVNDKLEKLYFVSYRPECTIKPLFVKVLTRECKVNNGTKAKPIIKIVDELVKESITLADELELEIESKINQLKF